MNGMRGNRGRRALAPYLDGKTDEDFVAAAADAIADILHAVSNRVGVVAAGRAAQRGEDYFLQEVVEDE